MRTVSLLALYALSSLCHAQDKIVLPSQSPKEGKETVFQIDIKFQAMGQDASFSGQAHQLITKVETDGSYSVDSWVENGKILIMGSEQEQPDERKTKKFDKSGKPLEKEDFQSALTEVIAVFSSVKFPAEGATAGQGWKLSDWFDRIGEGKGVYSEVVEISGQKAAKVDVEYSPKAGGSSKGFSYFSTTTGEFVGLNLSFTKVDIAAGIQSDGTITMKLIEK